jgi:outer membrane receptor protein involved in Fe transport
MIAKFNKTVWNGLINLHASWATADDRWTIVAWCKNLRNITYVSAIADSTLLYESLSEASDPDNKLYISYFPNPPRTFGITLRAQF